MEICKNRILIPLLLAMLLLGEHKGYLALWKGTSPDPFQIFPVKISSLPPEDQDLLSDGVPVRSESELSSLLEDFLS